MLREEFAGVRGIYFDLDDTLCGYWDASKRALRQTFAELVPAEVGAEAMVGHWANVYRTFAKEIKTPKWYPGYLVSGEPTRTEQMRLALEAAGFPDPALARRIGDRYRELRNAYLVRFPETTAVLDALVASYPIGLITNGPADIQREEIATLGLEPYVQHVFIEGEMGEGKPKPGVFDRAARAMGLGPSELLMVGNSYGHDIVPAIAAGWRTAWIRRPSDVPPSAQPDARPEERQSDGPIPTVEITDLRQLFASDFFPSTH
ncbi:MAG: HAD family hydrolase [Fimbriimonadaceae bacterium]|nr:HAD family hydrolase [Fimbriimonadaceae bacterium]